MQDLYYLGYKKIKIIIIIIIIIKKRNEQAHDAPDLFVHLRLGAMQQRQYSLVDLDFLQQFLLGVVMHLVNPHATSPARSTRSSSNVKKVKFSHTRYRALGPEVIPVYRQSARR